MKRIPGLFLLFVLLTGCADQGYENPWAGHGMKPASAGQEPAQPESQPVAPVQQQGLNQAGAATGNAPVKVALLLPLSGKNAPMGQAMEQAAQLAVFDMGYKNFELEPEDTHATPEGAKDAADAAISSGAQLILGPLFSVEVRAVKPEAAIHNVNVIAFSTDWTQAGGNTFVMGFLPFSQVQRVVEYANAKGYKRIGLIAPQSDYGNAVTSFYNALANRYGFQPAVIHLPAGGKTAVDFLAFNQGGQPSVDAVLIAVGGGQAAAVSAQLTAAGMGPDKVRRLGTGLWDESSLASDPNFAGAWYAAPQPDLRKAFEKKYMETYGAPAPRLSTLAYDATALAAVLARNAAGRGQTFDRTAIENPNGFSGIDGVFRFGQDGLIDRGMAVLQMDAGSVNVVDPAPRTFQKAGY
jgi:branched-chain amino acid transport system substrate-binding protein